MLDGLHLEHTALRLVSGVSPVKRSILTIV